MNPGMQLLIACVVIWIFYRKWKKNRDVEREEESESKKGDELKVVTIPTDAHDAVATFARFTNSTYSMIEQMSPGRDKYFYQIIIELKFGEDDASSQAEFQFDFDFNMDGFHENFGYKLGTGFSVENGDYVYYRSRNISNLYSWVGAAAVQHKQNGMPFDKNLANECANGIVATVVNNCPDAYVSSRSASEDGFYLIFKFR